MKRAARLSLALLVVGGALAFTPAVRAQQTPPTPAPPAASDHGMMGGDMRGMMNMMGEMNKMMENCNRMMQTRHNRQNTDPGKKDGRG